MFTILWSVKAKTDYWNNIDYLEQFWSLKEVYNFIDIVDELADLLSKGNVQFKPTNYKNTYQVVVIKQITIYYKVENSEITLLRFWNNYQDLENFSL
jgi:plasmid stabilization system protein ParE